MSTSDDSLIKAPFGNESESNQISDLTFENRTDRISIHGDIDITLDKAGLEKVKALASTFDHILNTMGSLDLPDAITITEPTKVSSPFK